MDSVTTAISSPLAIFGGPPIRKKPMPPRYALGSNERAMLNHLMSWYDAQDRDPGYQDHFENLYCRAFVQMMGSGYADAVTTGTAALYIALHALDLPKDSDVLVSPITDPGTLSAIILSGLQPKLLDSKPNSFNTDFIRIKSRLDQNTSCVLIVHTAGQAVEMSQITKYCHEQGVKVLEDCSQAHGAKTEGQLVGTHGDIAAFSTMHRKASITGPTGGLVYTRNKNYYHKALAHADRGKPSWEADFDDRDPRQFLFPALNLHSNEIACAIGLASLKRLAETIDKRVSYLKTLSQHIDHQSQVCASYGLTDSASPFYIPVFVDREKIKCSKTEFAKAIRAEGIGLNPHYHYLAEEWPWLQPYLADDFHCGNAKNVLDKTFCLYVNENYGKQEFEDIMAAILKIEQYFLIN